MIKCIDCSATLCCLLSKMLVSILVQHWDIVKSISQIKKYFIEKDGNIPSEDKSTRSPTFQWSSACRTLIWADTRTPLICNVCVMCHVYFVISQWAVFWEGMFVLSLNTLQHSYTDISCLHNWHCLQTLNFILTYFH